MMLVTFVAPNILHKPALYSHAKPNGNEFKRLKFKVQKENVIMFQHKVNVIQRSFQHSRPHVNEINALLYMTYIAFILYSSFLFFV